MSRAHPERPLLRATILLLYTTFALVPGLSACGIEEPPPRPAPGTAPAPVDDRPNAAPLLTEVINRIDQYGSAHSDVRGNLGLVGELAGRGAINYEPGSADLTLGGHTRPAREQPRQRVAVKVVDDTGYLSSPLLEPEPGKPWLAIAPGGHDFAAKLLGPALRQLRASADPRAAFAGVEPATRIESSSPDMVEGRATTRYDLRVITAQAARTAPDHEQRNRFRQAAEAGVGELEYRLWLDTNRLPVRFATTRKVDQAGKIALTSTYRDWGAPVGIQPPAPESIGVFRDLPVPQAHPR
ncbi:hypothetical protein [Parasphingorhabdus pacifica]